MVFICEDYLAELNVKTLKSHECCCLSQILFHNLCVDGTSAVLAPSLAHQYIPAVLYC